MKIVSLTHISKRHEQEMNLPEIEMTVHVIRVLQVAIESRDLKISKVILIRITENIGKMQNA